ncbi:MAG: VOC family protein [Sphingopyxis sp.]|nr:VOC family protein [Sphingopyxis sp.]
MNQASHGPTTGLTPRIAIADRRAREAIDFYVEAFGAAEDMRMYTEDGSRLMHAHLTVNGAPLMMHDEFPEYVGESSSKPNGVTLHLHVDDADAWVDRAVAAGARVVMPVADMFWGERYGQIKDPFGHQWSIGGPMKGG